MSMRGALLATLLFTGCLGPAPDDDPDRLERPQAPAACLADAGAMRPAHTAAELAEHVHLMLKDRARIPETERAHAYALAAPLFVTPYGHGYDLADEFSGNWFFLTEDDETGTVELQLVHNDEQRRPNQHFARFHRTGDAAQPLQVTWSYSLGDGVHPSLDAAVRRAAVAWLEGPDSLGSAGWTVDGRVSWSVDEPGCVLVWAHEGSYHDAAYGAAPGVLLWISLVDWTLLHEDWYSQAPDPRA